MRSRNGKKDAKGFTLIELVMVVSILGILATFLLPRVVSLRDNAIDSSIQGVATALEDGIRSYRYFSHVKGLEGQQLTNIDGYLDGDLDTGALGQLVGIDNNNQLSNDHDCRDLFIAVLDTPPSIDRADPNKERGQLDDYYIDSKLAQGYEWVAGQDISIPDATISLPSGYNAELCQYIYLGYGNVDIGAPKKTIFLDTRTGRTYLDLARVF